MKKTKHDKLSIPSLAYGKGKITKQEIFFVEISERLDIKEWRNSWIKEIPGFVKWYKKHESSIDPHWSHQDIVKFYFRKCKNKK